MAELISFFVVIAAGLFFAEFFRPFHLPYVVTLIIAGILIGPSVLHIFIPDNTIEFIGEVGLVFLMFMAGMETRLHAISNVGKSVWWIALLNCFIPFFAGVGISLYLGYGWTTAFFLGVIFMSSSIAVVIPSLEVNSLLKTKLGKSILGATIMEDILSLVALSILLQTIRPTSNVPLPIFYFIIFVFLFFIRLLIKELRKTYRKLHKHMKKDIFENELRFIFAILLATVVLFEILGLHAIIAGFFAGMTLSESIKKERLRKKLHTLSYGLFIPVFFIVIGANTDLDTLFHNSNWFTLIAIILVSILSKLISGFLGGIFAGFSKTDSAIVGASTIPQLSTTLAVAFTGSELGLLSDEIIVTLTTLSILTTLLSPMIIGWMVKKRS